MNIAIFKNLCPNCYGSISYTRLKNGLPCSDCLPEPVNNTILCETLEKTGKLKRLSDLCRVKSESEKFSEFFKEKFGFAPWALQETWARRVILGNSFAILAPTGVGKTTFGLAMAAFIEGKAYIIVPTKVLVKQAFERISSITDKKIVAYTGKKDDKERIKSGDFDILISTHMFLYKNFDLVSPFKFKFIFVDDVDSLLKASKNIDYIVKLLGFTDRDIKRAMAGGKKKFRKSEGVLVISSATVQPRTRRVILFQNLLGFDVQKSTATIRNVVDTYMEVESFEEGLQKLPELIENLGGGGLVYVSMDLGREIVDRVKEVLGEKALAYDDKDAFEKFQNGDVEVLVGLSHHQNPLVRGIDMPERIRYAIFLGVPKLLIPANVDSILPRNLLRFVYPLRVALPDEREKIEEYAEFLNKYFDLREEQLEKYPKVAEKLNEIAEFIREKINSPDVLEKIRSSDEISLIEKDGKIVFTIGDATSYIQATGRTSRLFAGGLTKGLAVSLVYMKKAFRSLERRLRTFLSYEFEFEEFDKIDLKKVLKEIDIDRERVRKILSGEVKAERRDLVRSTLVIVESPNKARTIAGFFGRPQKRWIGDSLAYEVNLGDRVMLITASLGHILDLAEKGGIYGVLENKGFFVPVYATIKRCTATGEQTTENLCHSGKKPDLDKLQIIEAFRRLSMEVNEVYVATDPDSEGEKIAWDILLNILPFNQNIHRSEFHEVTPRAFREAIESPRDVNESLVKAQILRRIADRWVGFSLSQKLQKTFGLRSLSAGRVQTPVLGWVIKREDERKRKVGLLTLEFDGFKTSFRIEDVSKAREIFERAHEIVVTKEADEVRSVYPAPPFNTGELLRSASDFLGFSAEKTMSLAQELFERGLITYHRTDSTRVSDAGFRVAAEFIKEEFGPKYLKLRKWGKGGAHECIRPTRPIPPDELRFMVRERKVELDDPCNALRLYSLIWRRFMASQMKEAKVKFSKLAFKLDEKILHTEEVATEVIEDGFNLLQPIKLVKLPEEFILKDKKLEFVPATVPYTQGTLIEEMRKRGIGRPSTYAKIVQTLLDRKYVVERGKFLFPTALGRKVYKFLTERYPEYTSEEFTRFLEEQMDRVEEGTADYQSILRDLKKVVYIK